MSLVYSREIYILFYFIYLFLKICFFMRDRERERERQREKQAPYEESDVGLDPRTPGPCPEPKADVQPLSHAGIPDIYILLSIFCV